MKKNLLLIFLTLTVVLLIVLIKSDGLATKSYANQNPLSPSPTPMLVGQAATTSTSKSGQTPAPMAPKGQVTIAMSSFFDDNVDPHKHAGGTTYPFLWAISDGLLGMTSEGKLVPGLATSWEVTKDGLGWQFKLRKGVKFHDGETLTGEDVKFAWTLQTRADNKSFLATEIRRIVDRVEVVDDSTVIYYTKEPYPIMANRLFLGANPVSRKYVEKVGIDEFGKRPQACAGPFRFVDHKMAESFKFEAFPDYWNTEHRSTVKNILVKNIPDAYTRLAALRTGEVDLIEGVWGPQIAEVKGDDKLRLISTPLANATEWAVNFVTPNPLTDLRVRQAISYAIDRQTIIKKVFFGEGQPLGHYFGPLTFGHDPGFWKADPYDPEKAKKLLAEAGYPNGLEINIYLAEGSRAALTVEPGASFLEKVGIKAKIVPMEQGQYYARYRDKSLVGLMPIAMGFALDAGESTENFYTTGGGYSLYSDKEMDELQAKQKAEMDRAKREEYLKRMGWIVRDKLVRIPIVAQNILYAAGPRIVDWKPNVWSIYFSKWETIRVKE